MKASSRREEIVEEAVRQFGREGFAATSLDDISRSIGIRKQSLLYHFAGKDVLFAEAAILAARTFAEALDAALRAGKHGLDRIDSLVAGAHRLARRRPEVVALIREVARLGPPTSDALAEALQPQVEAAAAWLQRAMDEGKVRRQNPRVAVLTIYSAVVGHITESSVKRAMLGAADRREAEADLVAFLKAGLAP